MSHRPDPAIFQATFPLTLGICRENVPLEASHCRVELDGEGVVACALATGARPRPGQRVVVARPENGPPILLATLGPGDAPRALAGGCALESDGTPATQVRLRAPDGTELLRIDASEGGIVLTLPHGSTRLAAAGDLELEADSIRLKARRTDVTLEANDDVVLRGERVRLN